MRTNRTLPLIALVSAVFPAAALAQSATFDSYQPNLTLTNVDGWHPWDDDPSHSATVTDLLSHSGGMAVDIVGDSSGTPYSDLVQMYAISSGQWRYSAYQYMPSSTTGADSYFILMNTYVDGGAKNWSTQVRFDLGTNTVYDDLGGGSNVLPLIRDQWVPITVDIDLDNNTQVISYNNQALFSGAWTRMGGAVLSLAAVDLYGSSASHTYYDDVSLVQIPAPASVAAISCFFTISRRRRPMAA